MPKAMVTLLVMFMLAMSSLHSPAMAHEIGHCQADLEHAASIADAFQDDTGNRTPDADRGVPPVVHDHHAPAGVPAIAAAVTLPAFKPKAMHAARQIRALASWATPPPVEPPAA